MFTLANIEAAHEQFTGPEFPKLIDRFKEIGMVTNTVNIETGTVSYQAENGQELTTRGYQVVSKVAEESNATQALQDLARHQAGQTDFPTFCEDMAKSGICLWRIDLVQMTCAYEDKAGKVLISENIPSL